MKPSLVPEPAAPPTPDPRIAHGRALVSGADTDRIFHNKLITLYSKSPAANNRFSYPLRVFRRIADPNVVSWTALISASSDSLSSLCHFVSMLRTTTTLPNQRTLASLFKTCASLSSLSFGLSLHSLSLKLCLSSMPYSGSALITFYSKIRLPWDARKVFDEMPHRDEFCYAATIVGLAQNGMSLEALSVFADMRFCNVGSSMYSVSGALNAAAKLAALDQCRVLHGHAVVAGLDLNAVVASALVDGYGKAGIVGDARRVFEERSSGLSVVGWNAMMAGYAQQGDAKLALEVFGSMKPRGLVPDGFSFLAVLGAFCNAGLVEETKLWLDKMRDEYRLEPWLQHYTCLVSAMGRAGQLRDAERIAMTMPMEPDTAVWRALLSASATHGEADMAKAMAIRLLDIDPYDDSAYVIAANVLSAVGRWTEVAEMRTTMKDRMVRKESGRSWVEVQGKVHVFHARDRKHEMREEIYAKLAELRNSIEKLGYVLVWDEMLYEVGEGERKESLWCHSEKLAMAFAVASGAALPGKVLRIVKNLRICKDCHEAFKYFSIVLEREIVVRDANRYHRFLKGTCTCQDIW